MPNENESSTTLNVDGLVDGVRELAKMARAAQKSWNLAYTVYDEGEPAEPTPPDDEREVLVFLNGDVVSSDMEGREGGGWGHRLGRYDHDKGIWRVHGTYNRFVTHWTDLPPAPAIEVTP